MLCCASNFLSFCLPFPHPQGYALIEYGQKKEGEAAIAGMNGAQILTQTVAVSWALAKGPCKKIVRR